MKKITLIIICAILAIALLAQAPQGISHQAVIRDASNQLVTGSPIGIQISIIQGAPDGAIVYAESHLPSSNDSGLISFVIGQGSLVSGVFVEIDWFDGPYFIKTQTVPAGGTNYTITGTSLVFSVPYAQYSSALTLTSANGYKYNLSIDGYGALYNWHAVANSKGLCPSGWKVPSHEEFSILEGTVDNLYGVGDIIWDSVGSRGYDGGKILRSTTLWPDDGNGTDDFGASIVPACRWVCNTGDYAVLGNFTLYGWKIPMMMPLPGVTT